MMRPLLTLATLARSFVYRLTWHNATRTLGAAIVLVELRQVLVGKPVDQGLLLLAAGLLGLANAVRRRNGENGSA